MRRAILHYVSIAAIYAVSSLMIFTVSQPLPVASTQPSVTITEPRPIKPRLATQGIPARVTVPSLSIDLGVKTGEYDANTATWAVDNSGAFYAPISVPVNDNNGITLIYAHAQTGLFETLPEIQPGAEAIVTTDNGHTFHYTYQTMRKADPSDVSVFQVDGPPTLVLQTCMGEWSQYRALFSFNLTKVE